MACETISRQRSRSGSRSAKFGRSADITSVGPAALNTQATCMRGESIITWEQVKPIIERGGRGGYLKNLITDLKCPRCLLEQA